jgi:hypothetical protein
MSGLIAMIRIDGIVLVTTMRPDRPAEPSASRAHRKRA